MLGKLLKYEFKATSRTFLPIYAALILVALVNRLFRVGNIDIGFGLTTAILFGLFVALFVLTLLVIIERFNKNLLSDEGYLMFTLPVKPSNLILSKLLATLIWSVCSGIVAVVTFFLLFFNLREFIEIMQSVPFVWHEMIDVIKNELGTEFYAMAGLIIMIGISSYIQGILTIYSALATAQLPVFIKHRGIISFIAFFVINTVVNFIATFLVNLMPFLSSLPNMTVFIMIAAWGIIIDLVLFVMTYFILNKHLNLE